MNKNFKLVVSSLIDAIESTFKVSPFAEDTKIDKLYEAIGGNELDDVKEFANTFIDSVDLNDSDKGKIIRAITNSGSINSLLVKLNLLAS